MQCPTLKNNALERVQAETKFMYRLDKYFKKPGLAEIPALDGGNIHTEQCPGKGIDSLSSCRTTIQNSCTDWINPLKTLD